MRLKPLCVFLLLCGLFPAKASADNRFIVRMTLGLQGLQTVCNPLLLTPICTVIGSGLGDPQGQLFTITTPLALNDLLALPGNLLGIVDAEVDQLVSLFPIGSLNVLPSASAGYLTPLMSDRTLVPYPASSGRTSACNGLSPCVWDAYANRPAARIVRVSDAQSQFGVTGAGIVADIDTGVDPTHPALQGVLLPGYDFTRNQPGGYYPVRNYAQVINMSFDTQTSSRELKTALNYANKRNVICVASAGNKAQSAPPLTVYPAEWQNDVMGVASTSDQDTRSSFSNYGNAIVWVAAPGEAIVTTYPFGTYAAGWGTSFSAPFVSGGSSLLLNMQANTNEPQAARAVAHAVPVGAQMGHGRLDLVQALGAAPASDLPPTGSIDRPSGSVIVLAGQSVFFSGSGSDPDGKITGYSWSFPGGEPEGSNVATPGSVTYSTPGVFVVTFTVTDDAGLKDPNPKTRTIFVLP